MRLLFLHIRLVVHLREDVSTHLPIFLRDVKQLRPREVVIEIVVEVVILWQAPEIAVLHLVEVGDLGPTYGWHKNQIINRGMVWC